MKMDIYHFLTVEGAELTHIYITKGTIMFPILLGLNDQLASDIKRPHNRGLQSLKKNYIFCNARFI